MKKEDINLIFKKNLGLNVVSVKILGRGTSNLNYLVKTSNRAYVLRINADPQKPEKSKKEFNSLKSVEDLGIGPRPVFLGKNFIILDYIEGKPFTGKKLNNKILIQLAQLIAKIHMEGAKNLQEGSIYNSLDLKNSLDYIKSNIKDAFLSSILEEASQKLLAKQKDLTHFFVPKTITHGDICEQNLLETKNGLALIDFESLSLMDPAEEIAKIFVDFKVPFSESQKKIFLKAYFKFREDKTLEKRIKIYEPLIVFFVFVWSLDYALKVRNKELNSSHLGKNELKKAIDYSKLMLKRAIKFKIISKKYSKLNLRQAFT